MCITSFAFVAGNQIEEHHKTAICGETIKSIMADHIEGEHTSLYGMKSR